MTPSIDRAQEDAAVDALSAGLVVVVPTDTVYGLAVALFVEGAVDALFALKDRPREVSIAVLVESAAQAERLVEPLGPAARRLTDRFWPGPLTLVLPRRVGVTFDIGGDGASVGVRVPDSDLVRRLCRRVGPLATTSANRHREPTPAGAAGVAAAFAGRDLALVLDGGPCAGAPSTVIALDPLRVFREGAISAAEIASIVE